MNRIYTNSGQSISTKVRCSVDGKKYIISTAKDPRGFWQLAVFKVDWEIPGIFGKVNYFKPLMFRDFKTFEEAEKEHFKIEKLVSSSHQDVWKD